MTTRAQKLKLLLFILISALVALGLLIAFAGVSLFERTDRYHVLVPDSVEGLEIGSPVKVQGVHVGSVDSFELNPPGFRGVRVTLEVDPEVVLSRNSKAFMKFKGVTGLRLIDIEQGSLAEGKLQPGDTIPYAETTIDRLSERADDLIERSLAVAETTEKLMERALVVAERFDVERLNQVFGRAEGALVRLEGAGRELEGLFAETRPSLRALVRDGRRTLVRADVLLAEGSLAMERLEGAALYVSALLRASDDDLRLTVHNLRDASESFKDLGRELRQNPSSLLFSTPPPERPLP